ncbi:MAG: hypothetical protein IJ837_02365 [Clostridia bacterium]|nr:hypothetical protein [Clostridia bacterium]
MNRLKLTIKSPPKNLCVEIDGEVFEPEKNDFSNYCYSVETEKETMKIVITRFLELETKFWWLWQILYFFVSLFGILDLKQENRQLKILYSAEVELNGDNFIDLIINKSGDKAVNILNTNAEIKETENKLEKSKTAIKRKKIIKYSKIVAWILIFVIVFLVIFLR